VAWGATRSRESSARRSLALRDGRGGGVTELGVHSKFETKSTSRTERPHRVSGENSTINICTLISDLYPALDRSSSRRSTLHFLSGIQTPGTRGSEDPGESRGSHTRHPIRDPRDPFGSAKRRAGWGGRRKSAREDSGSRGLGGRRIRGHPCDDSRTPALEDPRGSGGARARARAHFRSGVPESPQGAFFVALNRDVLYNSCDYIVILNIGINRNKSPSMRRSPRGRQGAPSFLKRKSLYALTQRDATGCGGTCTCHRVGIRARVSVHARAHARRGRGGLC